MDPNQLFEEVRRRQNNASYLSELRVFWTMFTGNRDEFAEELKSIRGEWPLIPVTLRESGLFQDPNAVMNDVAAIIENSKNDILSIEQAIQHHGHTDIIVISRRELRLAVTSSPTTRMVSYSKKGNCNG